MELKIKSKKLKNLLKKLKKLPLTIAQHAFFSSLILFFLALIIGIILFYKYTVLAQKSVSDILNQEYLLDEEGYNKIKEVWQKQEDVFNQADSKKYPNPFIKSLPFPE